jgi:hypothetical protein
MGPAVLWVHGGFFGSATFPGDGLTHRFYKFEPGQCVCLVGDPVKGASTVNVRKLSGDEVVLDPTVPLRKNQFIYTTLKLDDGTSLALSGVVVTTASGGVFLQWSHSKPGDADKVDRVIQGYFARKAGGDAVLVKTEGDAEPPAPTADKADKAGGRAPKVSASDALHPDKEPTEKIDLREHIRKKAKRVKAADLASRIDVVQVLDMKTIRSLIQEAVEDSVALLGPSLREEERKRLVEETEDSFKERLAVFRSEKAGLEEGTRLLQEKLEQAQAILEAERRSVVSSRQFTVSEGGMLELEQRLGRALDHAIRSGQKPGPDLERDLRSMVSRLLDDEREKIRAQSEEAQSDKIALLEKKVERLASSLQSAEKERDVARRRASALESSGVIAFGNVMEAGLDDEDPDRELKLKLLDQIVAFNKEVRQQLVSAGRVIPTRVRPAAAPPPETAPAGQDAAPSQDAAPAPSPEPEEAPSPPAPVEDVGSEEAASDLPGTDAEGESDSPGVDPDDMPWVPGAEVKEAKVRRLDRARS